MKLLKVGSQGNTVRKWQRFLIGQGFPLLVDGDFGPKTRAATVEFQKRNGLEPDGKVGNRTMGKAMQLGLTIVEDPDDDSKTGPNWPPEPDFAPLTGTRRRQEIFGRYEFVHEPRPDNRENIRILGDWERENIVPVELPQLGGVKGAPRSGKITFHRAAAPQLQALWKAWEKEKLLDRISSWSGSFVARFVRGSTRSLSNHAFGSAFDINVPFNLLGHRPALVGEEGSVRELVPLAHEHGFYWGGHFTRLDGMHFEVAVLEG